MGKVFIILGLAIAFVGLLLTLKIPIPYLGQLPGDLYVKTGNLQIYFPITTCVLLSLIISLIVYFFFGKSS